MAKKTIRNSYGEAVEVSDNNGSLINLQIEGDAGLSYLVLTEDQAAELGRTLLAFATVVSSQESEVS